MKKLLISIIILLVLLAIAFIYPLIYHFTDKEVGHIPEFISYEEAITKKLPEQILLEAEKHNCKNFILPLTNLPNVPSHLPFMIDDINLAISTYDKWKLAVDNIQREQIKQRLDTNLEKWGSMLSSEDMYKIITQRQGAEIHIDYSVQGSLSRVPHERINDLLLILTFNHEVTSSKLFDIRIIFTDPNSITSLKNEIALKQQNLSKLYKKNQIAWFFVKIILLFIGFFLFAYCLLFCINYLKTKRIKADLINQIKQLEDLINEGHFVAAFDLMNMYLEYFPNDIDMRAKRDRLSDLTNNDPKKAQLAYVEAKKIQLKLTKPLKGEYLSDNERENLKTLIPYHPELKDNFTKLLEFEETDKYLTHFNDNINKINLLINEKNFSQAKSYIENLKINCQRYNCPESDLNVLYQLNQITNDALNKSKEKFDSIIELLPDFQIDLIKFHLTSLLSEHKDNEDAIKLFKTLNNNILGDKFSLNYNGKLIHIIHKNEFILGREETGVKIDIAINDRHISRPHLKIFIKDREVIIEDLGSTSGTYINGDKIDKHSLKESDLLILAKVFELDYAICKDKNAEIGAVIINLSDCSYVLLRSELCFDIKETKLIAGDKFKVLVSDGVYAIYDDNGFKILEKDSVMNFNNQIFTMIK